MKSMLQLGRDFANIVAFAFASKFANSISRIIKSLIEHSIVKH